MYVAVVPNRGSPPAILLRESYREAGKTKNRTLANLSRWPAERIAQLRAVLREMLGLGKVAAKEVYAALDWLGREQPFIEAQLARRHLKDGALLLYDVTSTPAFARAGSTSKGAAASWRSMATAATIVATGRSWSSA